MGTSSGTRVTSWAVSSASGSGRFGCGDHSPWLVRGTSARAAFPDAARSATLGCSIRASGAALFDVVVATAFSSPRARRPPFGMLRPNQSGVKGWWRTPTRARGILPVTRHVAALR